MISDVYICINREQIWYPDPVNCGSYFQCSNNAIVRYLDCGPGEAFNVTTQQCMSNMECNIFNPGPTIPTTPTGITLLVHFFSIFPYYFTFTIQYKSIWFVHSGFHDNLFCFYVKSCMLVFFTFSLIMASIPIHNCILY